MNHYANQTFAEKYFIRFADMKGGQWRVSIEVPDYRGSAYEMTGSANPLEWMGRGDEDQTKIVLGSTGTLRIMVLDEDEEAMVEDIRPTEPNNRRVTAKRNDVIMWQGYVKQEEYSQDWISAPYEVEIPLVSMLEISDSITLPPVSTVLDKVKIIDCIDYAISLLGGSHTEILTNRLAHADISDWSQAFASIKYFYDYSEGECQPKSVKDVLETFLSPGGRIMELGGKIMIRSYFAANTSLYSHTIGSETGFTRVTGTGANIANIDITSLQSEGTDNTASTIAAPSEVKYTYVKSEEQKLFSIKDDLVKRDSTTSPYGGSFRVGDYARCQISDQYISFTSFCIEKSSTVTWQKLVQQKNDKKMLGSNYTKSKNILMNNALMFNNNDEYILLRSYQPINSNASLNMVLHLSMTHYDGTDFSTVDNSHFQFYVCRIKGGTRNYLKSNGTWTTTTTWLTKESMTNSGNTSDMYFQIGNSGIELMEFKMKMSEITHPVLVDVELKANDSNFGFTTEEEFFGDLDWTQNNDNATGDSIEYKHLTGVYGTNHLMPMIGFCSHYETADIYPRRKYEFDEMTLEDPTTLVLTPYNVTNGGMKLIPVATGMNARECTTRLTLISTNK